jgi:alanine racemase
MHFDMVWIGSAIYGLLKHEERRSFDLRPAMRVKSHVANGGTSSTTPTTSTSTSSPSNPTPTSTR